jgi:tetratricopeptide (TPR) repeat protein
VANEPERALNTLDDFIYSENPELAERLVYLNILFGQASLNLLEQRQAAGALGPALAADLLTNAEESFSLAASSQQSEYHPAALRGLARMQQRQGGFVDAWEFALTWHEIAHNDFNLDDHLLFGEIGLARLVAQHQIGADEMAAPHLAIESLEAAIAIDASLYNSRIKLADFHTWQQRQQMAATVLKEAITAAPDYGVAYQRLKTLCLGDRNLHTATLRELCGTIASPGTVLWYYGEALYLQARDARVASDFVKAMAALDKSQQAFEESAALDANFESSCRAWISIVKTQRVWMLRDEGNIDAAIDAAFEVMDYNPSALQDPLEDQSLANAIDYLIADIYSGGDMRKAIDLLRKVCSVDDTVALFVNNLGLFTRDLAGTLSRRGQHDEADQLYQESWDVYSRLVELRPEHPRSVNDRALIAVYYLDEHHEFAVQELHRVISIGEVLLAEMDENVPEEEHRSVDEAVGDAYENLAYYQVFRLNQVGNAEKLLKASSAHYPFKERGGVKMIRNKLEQIR